MIGKDAKEHETGFIEKEVAELKGMQAVKAWLSYHPELQKYTKK